MLEEEKDPFEDFFKVDEKMGEKRRDQIAGGILLAAIIVFAILYPILFR